MHDRYPLETPCHMVVYVGLIWWFCSPLQFHNISSILYQLTIKFGDTLVMISHQVLLVVMCTYSMDGMENVSCWVIFDSFYLFFLLFNIMSMCMLTRILNCNCCTIILRCRLMILPHVATLAVLLDFDNFRRPRNACCKLSQYLAMLH